MTITGGEYQGIEYGTMYDNNTIYNSADRYDDKNGLIGVIGYEQHKVDSEWVNGKYAMLWLREDNRDFVKGERYFDSIDKTITELVDMYKDFITNISIGNIDNKEEFYLISITNDFATKIGAYDENCTPLVRVTPTTIDIGVAAINGNICSFAPVTDNETFTKEQRDICTKTFAPLIDILFKN